MRGSSHFEWITAVRNFSSHSIYLPMTLFCAAKSKETKEVIERRSVTSGCHGERRKGISLYEQNNNFARASRFFVHFLAVVTHDCDMKLPNFTRWLYGVGEHGT